MPHQPRARSAMGAPRLPLARAARGNPSRIRDLYLATARDPGPYARSESSRCRRLPRRTPALKLTGPGWRRRLQSTQRALPGPGVTPSAPRPRPEPPTTFRNERDLWGVRSLKAIYSKTDPQNVTSDFKAGDQTAFHRSPSSPPGGARRGAPSRGGRAARAPAPSAGPRLLFPRVQRRGFPGSPATGCAAIPAAPPSSR